MQRSNDVMGPVKMNQTVYLDHNSTTPMRPGVAEAITHALAFTGNASSVHRHGRVVRRMVEEARRQVGALFAADPANVVFTSGGTEANNMAITGCQREVLVSAVEHPSVMNVVADAKIIPVDGNGVVEVEALDAMLLSREQPALVSVMLANNETGVIQPVGEIAGIAHRHGAIVHCDAVQAAGKFAFSMDELGVDMLSVSAHKIGGPPGIGALLINSNLSLGPMLVGGGQERGRRAGTENVPGIAGFGVAASLAADQLDEFERLAELRDEMECRILELSPATIVFGSGARRLANTSGFSLPGVESDTQVIAMDLAGVSVSAGSACSSGRVLTSHVLKSMGVDEAHASSAIRISMGWSTTRDDIERFIAAWGELAVNGAASTSSRGNIEPAA